jgi:hypothetical protein
MVNDVPDRPDADVKLPRKRNLRATVAEPTNLDDIAQPKLRGGPSRLGGLWLVAESAPGFGNDRWANAVQSRDKILRVDFAKGADIGDIFG